MKFCVFRGQDKSCHRNVLGIIILPSHLHHVWFNFCPVWGAVQAATIQMLIFAVHKKQGAPIISTKLYPFFFAPSLLCALSAVRKEPQGRKKKQKKQNTIPPRQRKNPHSKLEHMRKSSSPPTHTRTLSNCVANNIKWASFLCERRRSGGSLRVFYSDAVSAASSSTRALLHERREESAKRGRERSFCGMWQDAWCQCGSSICVYVFEFLLLCMLTACVCPAV